MNEPIVLLFQMEEGRISTDAVDSDGSRSS